MLSVFKEHPGQLYVVATLLPLAAFVILLLAGALRQALRSCQSSVPCALLYRLMGGDAPGRLAAYLATGAIGLAFVLSAIGFWIHHCDTAGPDTRKHAEV